MATKKYVSLSKLSTFLDNLKDKFAALIHTHTISDITDFTIDSELSSTSTNPVQNKALDAEFDAISQAMNVLDSAIDDKADSIHNHTISDVTDLQFALDTLTENKSDKTHTHDNATQETGGMMSADDKTKVDNAVLTTEQSLTDEQKLQARDNIGAVDENYVMVKPLPVLRRDYKEATYGTIVIKSYITYVDILALKNYVQYVLDGNIDGITNSTRFIVICEDGTEKICFGMASNGFIYCNGSNTNKYLCWGNNMYQVDLSDKSTADNIVVTTLYNTQYLSIGNRQEYTPSNDYNPATKKYVDDSVAAIPEQVQSDWSQIDDTANDYIKNKPEIATDDEIINMLAEEDILPVVTDVDGSILSDENNNILLW